MDPFAVKDCALISRSTGERAHDLRELRDRLLRVPPESIYHHFWAGLLRPIFDDVDYRNDFAAWAERDLHDDVLAERLSILTPTEFEDMEELRREVLELVEERLDEWEGAAWLLAGRPFYFSRSTVVVFDTGARLGDAASLGQAVGRMSSGSIFYHFIDARRRTPGRRNDFEAWLEGLGGQEPLMEELSRIDPYGRSLTDLRQRLAEAFQRHL